MLATQNLFHFILNPFMTHGHTHYCELIRRTHVEKITTRVYLTAYMIVKFLQKTHNLQTYAPLNTRRTAGRSLEFSPLMPRIGLLALCHFSTEVQQLPSKHRHARTHGEECF